MKKMIKLIGTLALIFLVLPLSVQAFDFKAGEVDASVGGIVRIAAYERVSDFGDVPTGTIDTLTHFGLDVVSDSLLYVKATTGKITAYAELGVTGVVQRRLLYLTYDLGGGNSILIGQNYSNLAEDCPNQRLYADNVLIGFGDLYPDWHPQIRFTHVQDKFTLKLALEETGRRSATEMGFPADSYLTEEPLPALVASFSYDSDMISLTPSAKAQTYTLKGNGEGIKDVNVTSYVMAMNAAYRQKAFTLSGEGWYGQNVALPCFWIVNERNLNFGVPAYDGTDGIENVNAYGGWLQLMVPINTGKFFTGAGYSTADVKSKPVEDYDSSVYTWAAFINYEYPIAKGFTITPEITYMNYGNAPEKTKAGCSQDANSNGTDVFIGVHMEYSF